MPFEVVRNDIAKMAVDAIVNTANPRPVIGAGVDSAIHQKAGSELLKARQRIGQIGIGQAAVTPAFALDAKYVIHTVGPVWEGGSYGEEALLRSCYDSSLALAKKHNVTFIKVKGHSDHPQNNRCEELATGAIEEYRRMNTVHEDNKDA